MNLNQTFILCQCSKNTIVFLALSAVILSIPLLDSLRGFHMARYSHLRPQQHWALCEVLINVTDTQIVKGHSVSQFQCFKQVQ